MILQESLNEALQGQGAALLVDGAVGPKTLAALEKACPSPTAGLSLARDLISRRGRFYLSLGKNVQYAWAVGGWMNRTRDLWTVVTGSACPF